ncbi:MAG TPA: hypothetical protein VGN14_02470 [Candidatus Elarobacter sp.]
MTALVPYQPKVPKKNGAATIVQFAVEGVAADVRVERVDRRTRSSWYAVRLASTESDVTGRLIGVMTGGEIVDLGGLSVAPGSIGSARLTVTTPKKTAYREMFLEIRADNVLLRVDAPIPPVPRGPGALKLGALVAAVGATVATGGGLVGQAIPRAPLLGAPATAIAGTRVRVPYETRGYGTLAYTATTDAGAVLASGPLADRAGEIAFSLPAGAAAHRVEVALAMHGPLGSAARSASFAVTAPPPPAPVARILSLATRRDATPGGETVLASYLVVGDAGTVTLTDPAGKVVASSPFTHRGTTRIAVPPALRTFPLVARLSVSRGGTLASASVAVPPNAIPVVPAALAAETAAAEADVPESVSALDSAADPHGGIIAIAGRAIAGRPLDLRVMPNPSPMHAELQDENGESLAEVVIAPNAVRAVLPLPAATAPTKYVLVLHYDRGNGEETVVRTVLARPAR